MGSLIDLIPNIVIPNLEIEKTRESTQGNDSKSRNVVDLVYDSQNRNHIIIIQNPKLNQDLIPRFEIEDRSSKNRKDRLRVCA